MPYKRQAFIKILNFLISIKCLQSALLYPQFTVIQLVGSISVPVTELPKDRKVFFDWGLQMNYDMPYNISSFYMAPIWPTKGSRNLLFKSRAVHKYDFTARELYEGFRNILERYGFDRSCLEQSICDLSQYPFDEAHGNVLTDVVNFILKPSVHQDFFGDKSDEGAAYSLAEDRGLLGKNCQQLYPECVNSLFNILTSIAL